MAGQASCDRFRLILQNVRDFAIFSADLNGHINEWNPGAERFFGYSEKEILGQHMELLYVPEDRAAGRAELEKAQAAQTGYSEDERWHLKKDGTRFFVSGAVNAMYDDNGGLCGFIKVARDITVRKRLQDQIAASEAEHRLILDAIKDFAIVSLDLKGTIQTWNPGAALTYGYEGEEIVGKNHGLLFTGEDQTRGEPEKTLAAAMQDGVWQNEQWRVRKDGAQVFVIDVVRPILNEFGQIHALLKVSRDITLRHTTRLKLEATQRELEAIRAELEQKVAFRTAALEQTVQSLEQVLYHVAHDLRAPLRSMEGFSNILVQKYSGADAEAERLTYMISEAARRMDHLIHDLLTYGRLCHEEVRCEKVALETAVESTLMSLEPQVRRSKAQVDVQSGLPAVWANLNVLKQVLAQLISNALTFVTASRVPRLKIWAEPRQTLVRVWIEDNGVGISAEYLERIFWLFERLSQHSNSSTGMGLAIARKGVERMGGKMGVESTPAAGSRFWIELPAVVEEEA
jgi:PAS domain S-box-containing protein